MPIGVTGPADLRFCFCFPRPAIIRLSPSFARLLWTTRYLSSLPCRIAHTPSNCTASYRAPQVGLQIFLEGSSQGSGSATQGHTRLLFDWQYQDTADDEGPVLCKTYSATCKRSGYLRTLCMGTISRSLRENLPLFALLEHS